MEHEGILNSPELIYNIDETGFNTDHKPGQVVGTSDRRIQIPSIVSSRGFTTTVISCVNGIGQVLPPYFIFKGKKRNDELMENALPGSVYNLSDSGWSNGQIFADFLDKHFKKYVTKKEGQKVLLLFDGHKSHITAEVKAWAQMNSVILFLLPPHTSHALQPLDVACFAPLKQKYSVECDKYLRDHKGHLITRFQVAGLVSKAYGVAFTPATIIASFRKSGIFPFDPSVISEENVTPSKVSKYPDFVMLI